MSTAIEELKNIFEANDLHYGLITVRDSDVYKKSIVIRFAEPPMDFYSNRQYYEEIAARDDIEIVCTTQSIEFIIRTEEKDYYMDNPGMLKRIKDIHNSVLNWNTAINECRN